MFRYFLGGRRTFRRPSATSRQHYIPLRARSFFEGTPAATRLLSPSLPVFLTCRTGRFAHFSNKQNPCWFTVLPDNWRHVAKMAILLNCRWRFIWRFSNVLALFRKIPLDTLQPLSRKPHPGVRRRSSAVENRG